MIVAAAPSRSPAQAGTFMAVGSMTCVQLGLALSVPLFGQVGPLGAVWLRLAWAGVILATAGPPDTTVIGIDEDTAIVDVTGSGRSWQVHGGQRAWLLDGGPRRGFPPGTTVRT